MEVTRSLPAVAPPWNEARTQRRAHLRAAIAFAVSVPLAGPLMASCAWVLVPVALFEAWCLPLLTTTRRAIGAGLGVFLFAFVLLLAAHFQVIYAHEVLASRSV